MKHIKYLLSGASILGGVFLAISAGYYLFFWAWGISHDLVYAIVGFTICYGVGWAYFTNPDEPTRRNYIKRLPWYKDD